MEIASALCALKLCLSFLIESLLSCEWYSLLNLEPPNSQDLPPDHPCINTSKTIVTAEHHEEKQRYTRPQKTLDHCYGTISGAHHEVPGAALGISDQ